VKTARLWRGIVSFMYLAREGRMTVTMGRRELLAARGGVARRDARAVRNAARGPALTDLLGGQVQLMFPGTTAYRTS
jgi:hypothetical protein